MEENPASLYFTFRNNITTQPYLSCTLFEHFKQYKITVVHHLNIFNILKLYLYVILAFSIEKTPVVPYFCIFNIIRPRLYISCTLL